MADEGILRIMSSLQKTEKFRNGPARGRTWNYISFIVLVGLIAVPPAVAENIAGMMTGPESRQNIQQQNLAGDINRDGIISSLDALIALQMSTGKIPTDLSADANGDGQVTSFDAAQILRISTGVLPVPSTGKKSDAILSTGAGDIRSNAAGIVVVYPESLVKDPLVLSEVTVSQTLVAVIPTTRAGGSAQTVAVPFWCVAGYSRCGDECRDLTADIANCGSCGIACASGYTCTLGNCTRQCSAGLAACEDVCVDLLADARNCGSCGRACMTGITCSNGQCVAQMVTTQPTRLGSTGFRNPVP